MNEEIENEETELSLEDMLLGVSRNDMERVSLEGAEIVRRQYLSHIKDAVLTVRPDGITFNNACIAKMLDTYYIQIFIDRDKRRLIIRGCDENDMDGQKWCNERDGLRKSRKITGRPFCSKLYSMMEWSKGYYYKICGTPALRMENEDELLFVFELTEAECFALTKKARERAGVTQDVLNAEQMKKLDKEEADEFKNQLLQGNQPEIPKRERYPEGWKDSFGPIPSEHVDRVTIPYLSEIDISPAGEFATQKAAL